MKDRFKTLITFLDPKSNISESYRVLRTNLQFSSVDKKMKTIVVTSSAPGEGKTTSICNMAVTFAQAGNKVLLIDGDLRKPRIHRVFHEKIDKGLSLAITNLVNYKSNIVHSEIPNLDLILAGPIPPNPAELLASNNFKALLEVLEKTYDYILIDSPPVSPFTDAVVMSTVCDGVIMVVSSGMVDKEVIIYSTNLFKTVKSHIIGVILNNLDVKSRANYNYYYYNYLYRYYYDNEESDSKKAKRERKKAAKKKHKKNYTYGHRGSLDDELRKKEFIEFLNSKEDEESK